MFFVDFAVSGDDRYLIVIDTMAPERNRIEKVSDQRFMEFIQKVLDINIPLSEIEQEMAV
ncbi:MULTISPECIES: hypothetical protein [Rhizobium]|uniref:hypothetical protein n=1 Tax=Rhizobium TaxID=379 RepID=UPI0004260524|nr:MULTISPECIES: hypothetical protein [Rhizobium]MBB3520991.1 hypothetical protein [Rhizobium sp. BK456]UFS81553.1 hypothetical protein LPB79_25105 [Rhizobium sp. T136]